jgi:hypothetical protein
MGRIYTAQFNGVALTAQVDFFEIVAPADAIVAVHELSLSQLTEEKDAEEEMLLILVKSGSTTSGSGGSSPTVVPRELGDAAFGGTVEANNTTKATGGTIVTHYAWHWNVRGPFLHIWTPETRPIISPSRRFTVELGETPVDSITFGGYIVFEEIGG